MIRQAPKLMQVVGFGLVILIVLGFLNVVYSLASGQSLPAGGAAAGLIFFAIFAYTAYKDKQPGELPQQLALNLQNHLLAHGVAEYRLALGDKVLHEKYPIPMVLGKLVYISPAIIKDLSPPALAWITLAEANADRKEPKYLQVVLGAFVLIGLIGAGLLDRYNSSLIGWVALVAVFPLALYALTKLAHLSHLKADRELPRSPLDLRAAKEAFSYAYFAQAQRSILSKFNFLRSEIKNRAAALGLELEQGFKAEA